MSWHAKKDITGWWSMIGAGCRTKARGGFNWGYTSFVDFIADCLNYSYENRHLQYFLDDAINSSYLGSVIDMT